MTAAIVLIGFKSCGKSTYGAMLAESLGGQFADLDRMLEQVHASDSGTQLAAHEIFRSLGGAHFAKLEERALREFIRKTSDQIPGTQRYPVLATTGATPFTSVNLALLRRLGPLILLEAPREVIRRRWLTGRLPAFVDPDAPQASFDLLYDERATLYSAVADEVVPIANRTDKEVLADIAAIARRSNADTKEST